MGRPFRSVRLYQNQGSAANLLAEGVERGSPSGYSPPSPDDEEESENFEFDLLSLRQEREAWQQALIHWALSRLNEKEKCVIERLYWDGWTEEEIAKELGISQQVVSKIKRKALKKLGEMLKGLLS